jgi:hypothetical protein
MFNNFNFFKMTYFDKFLMQDVSKYCKKKIMILKDFFKDFFKNVLKIF